MNKRIISLLMSAIICYSMVGTAFAKTVNDSFGEEGDVVQVETEDGVDKIVVLGPGGSLSDDDKEYVSGLGDGASVGGQEIKDETVKPNPNPTPTPKPDPEPDDDDDDDDDRGGGGGGGPRHHRGGNKRGRLLQKHRQRLQPP